MSTNKIDLSPVDGTPTPSIVPTFIGHCPGSPCAVCGRVDLPAGTIAPPNTHPLCGMHFAEWERTHPREPRTLSVEGVKAHLAAQPIRVASVSSDLNVPAPDGGGPATRAQLQAMRDLSIPFDLEHPPTFDDAARLIREAEEAENPMRVVMGPPVRDIREAMHPAESAGAVLDDFAHRLIDIGESGRAAVQGVVNEIAAKVAPGHEPPRMVWTTPDLAPLLFENAAPKGPTVHVVTPHVATLPDGTRVNLPAGTVLREGEDTPPVDACVRVTWAETAKGMRALLAQGEPADVVLAMYLGTETPGLRPSPTEHPLFALVRSFVGKPGDKPGPVWTALMCVQARLEDNDVDGAKDAVTALEEALSERIGQMHDALGRDTTEERTL